MGTNLRILLVACLVVAASQAAWGQVEMDRLSPGGDGLAAADPAPLPAPSQPLQPSFSGPVAAPPPEFGIAIPCEDACYQGTWQVFGDFLYLRPAQDRVAYAVPINGAIVPPVGVAPVQVGRIAVADVGFDPGFRAGVSYTLDEYSRLGLTYTHLEADIEDQVHVTAPIVLRSMVTHPGTQAAPTDFLDGLAQAAVRFKLADLDYRHTWLCDDRMSLNYVIGGRYAHLEQGFASLLTNTTTAETVDTRLAFDGGGIRFGLEGHRRTACSGLAIYGTAMASFVGGRFVGDFVQADNLSGMVVSTGWTDDRVIPILDLELGVAWVGCCGHLRVSGGYLFSAWFNVPRTEDFIHAVQTNDLTKLHDALTFDGLAARMELRF
jgi:hypothetical protein